MLRQRDAGRGKPGKFCPKFLRPSGIAGRAGGERRRASKANARS